MSSKLVSWLVLLFSFFIVGMAISGTGPPSPRLKEDVDLLHWEEGIELDRQIDALKKR